MKKEEIVFELSKDISNDDIANILNDFLFEFKEATSKVISKVALLINMTLKDNRSTDGIYSGDTIGELLYKVSDKLVVGSNFDSSNNIETIRIVKCN